MFSQISVKVDPHSISCGLCLLELSADLPWVRPDAADDLSPLALLFPALSNAASKVSYRMVRID